MKYLNSSFYKFISDIMHFKRLSIIINKYAYLFNFRKKVRKRKIYIQRKNKHDTIHVRRLGKKKILINKLNVDFIGKLLSWKRIYRDTEKLKALLIFSLSPWILCLLIRALSFNFFLWAFQHAFWASLFCDLLMFN